MLIIVSPKTMKNKNRCYIILVIIIIIIIIIIVIIVNNNFNKRRRKLKHYENLCEELSQGFESVIYVNLSMGALGLSGKGSKNFYDLLKMTLKKDHTNYLIKKITSCWIRTTYYIFCKKNIMG